MAKQSHAITVSPPPRALVRVGNSLFRVLLRFPPLGSAAKDLMVVSFSGRKTGKQYSIPLSAHHIDGTLYAITGAPWKNNFRGGTTAQVLHSGKTTTMRGELIGEHATVADLAHRASQGYGAKRAQRLLGVKFRDPQVPSLEEFAEAVRREHLVAIRFSATP